MLNRFINNFIGICEKLRYLIILLVLILFSSCSMNFDDDIVNIDDDYDIADRNEFSINSFEECILAGLDILDSYPRKCSYNGRIFIEKIETEPLEIMICTSEYDPVCAHVEVQCINAPCNPVKQTFSNSCSAGKNKILYKGICAKE